MNKITILLSSAIQALTKLLLKHPLCFKSYLAQLFSVSIKSRNFPKPFSPHMLLNPTLLMLTLFMNKPLPVMNKYICVP